jgi:predicted peroxiredoxin
VSIVDSIGNGFRFFLMSMGVSTYAKKPAAKVKPPMPPAKP